MLKVQEGRVSFPKMEEEMVQWWKENNIYEKSVARRENAPAFVFFDTFPCCKLLVFFVLLSKETMFAKPLKTSRFCPRS